MSLSIQTRVLALVGTGVFVAGGILSLLSRSSLLTLEDEVVREHERLAAAIAGGIATSLDDDLRTLAGAAAAPHIDLDDGNDGPEWAALDSVRRHGRLWSSVFFLSADGRLAVPASGEMTPMPAEAISAAMNAIVEQRPQVTDVMRDPDGRTRILWIVPFRSMSTRSAGAAAAALDLPARHFTELLQSSAVGRDLLVEIVDSRDRSIASTGRTADAETGSTPLAAVARIDGTTWRLRVSRTGGDPLAPIATFRRQSLWLAPSLAAVATLLAWGISRSVRRPLSGLTASAEQIARGDLSHRVNLETAVSGGDEIVRLAAALERMRGSLESSMRSIEAAYRELERRVTDRTGELAEANTRLEERERARQQLLRKVISAQEDERKRVARELHDETSQTLATLGIGVETALAACPPDARQRLADVRHLVARMHQELHRLIVNLRPSVLDDLGLAAAIRWFAERQLAEASISVRCEIGDLDARLPAEIETAVFRVVQEAIVNVSRHASADSVLIQGAVRDGVLTVEIEDDGNGFDPSTAAGGPGSLRGVGLLGMRERIEILGGTVTIDSEPGAGTQVVLRVPISLEQQPAA